MRSVQSLRGVLAVTGAVGLICGYAAADSVLEVADLLGLSTEALVAAQCNSSEVTAILQGIAGSEFEFASLQACQSQISASVAAATELAASVANGSVGEEQGEAFMASLSAISAAKQQYEAEAEILRSSVTAGLSLEKRQRLAAWRENQSLRVPSEFRVLQLDHLQWKAIERALRAEQRAIQTGSQLAVEHAQLLDGIRDTPDVVAAESALDTSLSAMTAHVDTVVAQMGP